MTCTVLVGLIVFAAAVVSTVLYKLLRRRVIGKTCESKARLDGKTVIITGANSGIGIETAIDLAGRKARVILACRSVEKGEKAAVEVREKSGNDDVVFRQLDLASLASVRQFAATVLEEEPRIDILVNNAGVMACPYSKTEDGFEMQFAVNHLAHFLLTNLLLDRLKEATSARIVVVTSTLYKHCPSIRFDDINSEKSYPRNSRMCMDPRGCYAHSKLANILFTQALAERLEGTNVTANAISPGMCRSDLGRHLIPTISICYRVRDATKKLIIRPGKVESLVLISTHLHLRLTPLANCHYGFPDPGLPPFDLINSHIHVVRLRSNRVELCAASMKSTMAMFCICILV